MAVINKKMKIKPSWLYLNPFVHLNVKKDKAVLYNTLNGTLLEYVDVNILRILKRLKAAKNLYVILLNAAEINANVSEFIKEIRGSFIGDILPVSFSEKKPVQLIPRLLLEKTPSPMTFKSRIKLLLGDEVGEYLNIVTLYINNRCSHNCRLCKEGYKQFLYCRVEDVHRKELAIESISELLEQLKTTLTFQLNIIGGDISEYSKFYELIDLLNDAKLKKSYYLNYLNFSPGIEWLNALENGQFNALHVLVHPPLKIAAFLNTLDLVRSKRTPYVFHFVVETEDDVESAETLISKYNLRDIEFHPYYNGRNLSFFKDNIFITKESLMESAPSMKHIFTNMSINPLDFKGLTVSSNNDVHANVNSPRLGVLGIKNIMEFVKKEMITGRAWGLVRKHVSPCKSCSYNFLCPPISNYERALGRYNLCHIWQKH